MIYEFVLSAGGDGVCMVYERNDEKYFRLKTKQNLQLQAVFLTFCYTGSCCRGDIQLYINQKSELQIEKVLSFLLFYNNNNNNNNSNIGAKTDFSIIKNVKLLRVDVE